MGNLDFSWALQMLKQGRKVAREGWNGKGMWVVLQEGYPDGVSANKNSQKAYGVGEGTIIKVRPYLVMCLADGSFVPWLPSQTDLLEEDWDLV